MIPARVYKRAVELTEERLRAVLVSMQDTQTAPIEERNAAYDALVGSANFGQEYELFEAKYPGEFQKIARRRRLAAQRGQQ